MPVGLRGLDSDAGREVATARVQRDLQVPPIRNTALMDVSYFDRDSALAAEIANGVVRAYSRLTEASAQSSGADMARIVDLAEPNRLPVRPNEPIWFFLGAVGSGGVAVFGRIWRPAPGASTYRVP